MYLVSLLYSTIEPALQKTKVTLSRISWGTSSWIHANWKQNSDTRTYLPSRHKQQSIQWYQHQKLMHHEYTYQLLTLKRVPLPIRNANLTCNTPNESSTIMSVNKNDTWIQASNCLLLRPFNLNTEVFLESGGIFREYANDRHPLYMIWANNS